MLPDVLLWRDSCNVYAVLGESGAVVVDSGTGEWLRHGVGDLPVPPRALVCTHYFRDHAGGAAHVARCGIPIYVSEGERDVFADPQRHFRRRETYLIYDNLWDLFAPAEPIPVAGVMRDYEEVTLEGISFRVVPLPGATPTQVGLVLRTPRSGRTVAFCGETIHSPGRVPRIAPLQYDYCDLLGAVNVAFSADLLRKLDPDVLLPSLGEPIADSPATALCELHDNLVGHCDHRATEGLAIRAVGHDTVESLTERVWRSTQGRAASHFLIGDSGRALILDYGYWHATGPGPVEPGFDPMVFPAYPFQERRRALLHSLDPLREQAGAEGYDAVIPTHYHDDHVCGIPLLQRVLGIECWAPANFAHMLADPAGHRFPCAWPRPIRVDRVLEPAEPLDWDGIRLHFEPMSGHTRFSALIGWEIDGVRFVHAGDQYGAPDERLSPGAWPAPGLPSMHVYANGAFLDSFRRSADWIAAFRPDVVLSGHWDPVETDDAYFDLLAEHGRAFAREHRRVAALDDAEPHFGVDGMAGWMWPYRVHVPAPRTIHFDVTVRNPLPADASLSLRLTGPDGWDGSTAELRVGARGEGTVPMRVTPTGSCRRQPVVVELHADGRPYGQVLEALVTVGGDAF